MKRMDMKQADTKHGNGNLIRDSSDVLLILALITLPADGTRLGITMPY